MKRLRVIITLMLVLSLVFCFASLGATAESATLSSHTINAGTTMYYYQGNACSIVADTLASVYMNFNRTITYTVGYRDMGTSKDKLVSTHYDGTNYTAWKMVTGGTYRFLVRNDSSQSVKVLDGEIRWNV